MNTLSKILLAIVTMLAMVFGFMLFINGHKTVTVQWGSAKCSVDSRYYEHKDCDQFVKETDEYLIKISGF